MAMLITNTGKRVFVPAEAAKVVWQILNGERQPANKKQAEYCKQVKRVYLSKATAPESYLQKNRHLFSDITPYSKQMVQSRLPYKD
jgi:hypothetical protein